MVPHLFHIYGPLYIQSYGMCIVLGLMVYLYLLYKDKVRQNLVSDDQFSTLVFAGIIGALIGGRLLYFSTLSHESFKEFFMIWQGGFAVLGSVIGVAISLLVYLKHFNVPILPALDRASLYAPLLQSIARIGCFLAGCCYGTKSLMPWAVIYSNKACLAPLGVQLHPAQLYSSLVLFFIFILLSSIQKKLIRGQLTALYIFCCAAERFLIDFWRGDQIIMFNCYGLTYYQFISLLLIISSVLFLALIWSHQRLLKGIVK